MVIVLDAFPTSCVARRLGAQQPTVSDDCHQWVLACEAAGHRIVVPAISYYEVLREMERRTAATQIARLKAFSLQPGRFLALATGDIELAARLWGQARRAGLPSADRQALDGDVMLAAQALNLGIAAPGLLVATTNAAHLSRYVAADLWSDIRP